MGIGKNIENLAKEKNIRIKHLAEKADVNYGTLVSIVKRDSDGINIHTLTKIAKALEVDISVLGDVDKKNDSVGERIKKARKELGISQKILGELIGVSEVRIGQWERNYRKPKIDVLTKIAQALDVDVSVLSDVSKKDDCVGEKIKKIRKEKGLTQKELGELLGVSDTMIGKWEGNNRKPKIDTLRKIANALQIDFTELMDNNQHEDLSEKTRDLTKKIRQLRVLKKLTQLELAEKAGVSLITIRRCEKEKQNLTIDTLYKIANALEIDLSELIDNKQPETKMIQKNDYINLIEKQVIMIESINNLQGFAEEMEKLQLENYDLRNENELLIQRMNQNRVIEEEAWEPEQ
jgi:transcriptional regulator with XRE-family HTH domain